jgi:hypothetical protein
MNDTPILDAAYARAARTHAEVDKAAPGPAYEQAQQAADTAAAHLGAILAREYAASPPDLSGPPWAEPEQEAEAG